MAISVSVGTTAVDTAQAGKPAATGTAKSDGDSFSSVLETSSESGGRPKSSHKAASDQEEPAPNDPEQGAKQTLDGKKTVWRHPTADDLAKAMSAKAPTGDATPDEAASKIAEFEAALEKFAKGAKPAEKDDKTESKPGATADKPDAAVADLLAALKDPQGAGTVLGALVALGAKPAATAPAEDKAGPDKDAGIVNAKGPLARGKDMPDDTAMAALPSEALPTTDEPDLRATTFRLSREDGTGQPISMRLGKEDAADVLGAAKTTTQDVSVLDARRFIGLMENKNSAAVTAAIAGDKELARAIQPSAGLPDPAATGVGKVVNTLKIQMTPENLGTVTATMRLSGEALSVDLKVETGAAYRQLKEDHSKIVEALRGQGYAVDVISVSFAPSPSADTGTQTGFQGQPGQQQSAMQQGQGQQAPQRQNFADRQQQAGGSYAAEEMGRDEGPAARPGSAGSVYL